MTDVALRGVLNALGMVLGVVVSGDSVEKGYRDGWSFSCFVQL